jgi:hypothetical protein
MNLISNKEKEILQNIFNKIAKKKNILNGIEMKKLANLINLDLTLVNMVNTYDFNQLLELIVNHRVKQLSNIVITHQQFVNTIKHKLDDQSGLLLNELLKNKTDPLNGTEAVEIINKLIIL